MEPTGSIGRYLSPTKGVSSFCDDAGEQPQRLPIRVSARRRITHARYEFILHQLGVSGRQWREWQGMAFEAFVRMNPHTTERDFLEDLVEQMEIARQFSD